MRGAHSKQVFSDLSKREVGVFACVLPAILLAIGLGVSFDNGGLVSVATAFFAVFFPSLLVALWVRSRASERFRLFWKFKFSLNLLFLVAGAKLLHSAGFFSPPLFVAGVVTGVLLNFFILVYLFAVPRGENGR